MAISGIRPYRLERKPFASGTPVILDLSPIPAGHRVRHIMLGFEDIVLTAGAAAALVTGDKLTKLINGVSVGNRLAGTVKTSGKMLDILSWLMQGKDFDLPADLPANNNEVFRRSPTIVVPFADLGAVEKGDNAPRVELLREEGVQVDFIDITQAPFTSLASAVGQLKPIAYIEPAPQKVVHAPVDIGYAEFAAKVCKLSKSPRAYTHLFLFKESGAAITAAELATVTLYVDGEPFFMGDGLTIQDLARAYNLHRANGANVQVTSATAEQGGEAIDAEASKVNAGTAVSLPWVPIYSPEQGHKVSKALYAAENIQVETTGTLADSFRLGYRAVVADDGKAIASALGLNPATLEPKTASKHKMPWSRSAYLMAKRSR
jgi:hypothetical protein